MLAVPGTEVEPARFFLCQILHAWNGVVLRHGHHFRTISQINKLIENRGNGILIGHAGQTVIAVVDRIVFIIADKIT